MFREETEILQLGLSKGSIHDFQQYKIHPTIEIKEQKKIRGF